MRDPYDVGSEDERTVGVKIMPSHEYGTVNLVRDVIDMCVVCPVVSVFTMHEFFVFFIVQRLHWETEEGRRELAWEEILLSGGEGCVKEVFLFGQSENRTQVTTKCLVIISRETISLSRVVEEVTRTHLVQTRFRTRHSSVSPPSSHRTPSCFRSEHNCSYFDATCHVLSQLPVDYHFQHASLRSQCPSLLSYSSSTFPRPSNSRTFSFLLSS